MPKEAALAETAGALVRTNPFSPEHSRRVEALGITPPEGPVWLHRTARRALVELLGPVVERLRARALRGSTSSMSQPDVFVNQERSAPSPPERLPYILDGLAAAWVAVAAPEDPWAYDLSWLARPPDADGELLATVRTARVHVLASLASAFPGESAAAGQLRADIWRAAWLSDAFLDIRGTTWAPPVPLVIWGPIGSPRRLVANLLAEAAPFRNTEAPASIWPCHLPATDAEARLRAPGPGLRFVDRIERASFEVQAALMEQLDQVEDGARWTFGMTTGARLEGLDPELVHRVAGAEIQIPSVPVLVGEYTIAPFVAKVLAEVGVQNREERGAEITAWIHAQLGEAYDWPGHLAELTRCVRARLVGRDFRPSPASSANGLPASFLTGLVDGQLDANTLLSRYCTWVYALTGSYVATAARLGIDRRTVRKKVDPALLPFFGDQRPV